MQDPAPPASVRAFVAIALPPAVVAGLVAIQRELAATGLPLRLATPAGLHLTLAFVGEVPAAEVPALVEASRRAGQGIAPFALQTQGLGMFPNAAAPRVIWAGVAGPAGARAVLDGLRRALVRELAAAGFPTDPRFDPHLTLARVRDGARPADRAAIGATVPALATSAVLPFPVAGLSVMRSEPGREGGPYSQLGYVALDPAAGQIRPHI